MSDKPITPEDSGARNLGVDFDVGFPAEIVRAIASGSLVLDCPKMTLEQNAGHKAILIRGRGLISILVSGVFEFRMYCDDGPDTRAEVRRFDQVISGTLVPETDYYTLRATSADGMTWWAERVLFKRTGADQTVIVGQCSALRHKIGCRPSASSVTLFFFDPPQVAFNRYLTTAIGIGDDVRPSMELAAAEFGTSDFKILAKPVDAQPGSLRITIEFISDEKLPAGVEHRILETLRYVTLTPTSWSIALKEHNGQREVTLQPRQANRPSSFMAPIGRSIFYPKDFWQLFALYLRHVIRSADSEHYSPLSAQLRALINSATQDLTVLGLLVSVAVEGVLNLEFADQGKPTEEFVSAVDATKKVLARLRCVSEPLRARATGALEQMKTPRASDKLKDLVAAGLITKDMVDSWAALRNASAHATIDPTSFDTQKLWSKCLAVYALLNLLVFKAIGYSGEFTDYSAYNWPIRKVPALSNVS